MSLQGRISYCARNDRNFSQSFLPVVLIWSTFGSIGFVRTIAFCFIGQFSPRNCINKTARTHLTRCPAVCTAWQTFSKFQVPWAQIEILWKNNVRRIIQTKNKNKRTKFQWINQKKQIFVVHFLLLNFDIKIASDFYEFSIATEIDQVVWVSIEIHRPLVLWGVQRSVTLIAQSRSSWIFYAKPSQVFSSMRKKMRLIFYNIVFRISSYFLFRVKIYFYNILWFPVDRKIQQVRWLLQSLSGRTVRSFLGSESVFSNFVELIDGKFLDVLGCIVLSGIWSSGNCWIDARHDFEVFKYFSDIRAEMSLEKNFWTYFVLSRATALQFFNKRGH